MSYQDRFSTVARAYARHRPGYPDALYDWLVDRGPGRALAWDAATGNGQAARALADRFEQVVATDASREQLANAAPHPRVRYLLAASETAPLAPHSADLVTVATAVHWFDLDAFYARVREVLRPGGVLAVWSYHLGFVTPAVDVVVERYYRSLLGAYWPPPVRLLERHYRDLPFPFEELASPDFAMSARWSLDDLMGFMGTWSAAETYRREHGIHPLSVVEPALRRAWGAAPTREVRWPLYLRAGRV